MNLFGLTITRRKPTTPDDEAKALTAAQQAMVTTVPTGTGGFGWFGRGWWPVVRESFAGAWQRNEEITIENVTAHWAVFACVTLISTDIGKMRIKLVTLDDDRISTEVENPAWSPFLRKPNHFQVRQRFIEWWQMSKLLHGNTYALKRRDGRGLVNAAYVLDPYRVKPLVSPDGSVFYQLATDNLAGLQADVLVPAREIFHDIYTALFHPLCGVSPLYAAGLAALQGLKIASSQTTFFANGSQPGGVLTAPGAITNETAKRAKDYWESNFGGNQNVGKVAVLGDGLKYEPMVMKAIDAQLIDQLKWTAEAICAVYRVPMHKIGIGQMPNYNNIEALDRGYYSQCLQEKIEAVEAIFDDGLELPKPYATEFDLHDLYSMDTRTLIETEKEAAGLKTINESRKRLNLKPVDGGGTVYVQQQNFSIEALARRDEQPAPSATSSPDPSPAETADDAEKNLATFAQRLQKGLAA